MVLSSLISVSVQNSVTSICERVFQICDLVKSCSMCMSLIDYAQIIPVYWCKNNGKV